MEKNALDEKLVSRNGDGWNLGNARTYEVARKFENCEYRLEEFTHERHLTVACWYLSIGPHAEALKRMRAGLQRFIAHYGKEGYHETITRFWMELLDGYLDGLPRDMPLDAKVKGAVEQFGRKDVLFAHYTRERVMSETARREWVEPDLRRIEDGEGASGEFEQILRSL